MFKNRILVGALLSLLPIAASASVYISAGATYMSTKSDVITYQGFTPKFSLGIDNDRVQITPASLYLGAEVTAMPIRTFTINDNSPASNQSLKQSWSYAINLHPGIFLDMVIKAYAILGLDKTGFGAGTVSGRQMGVGLEYKLSERWAGRFNFIYTRYSSVNGINAPKTEEVTVSAVYRLFC